MYFRIGKLRVAEPADAEVGGKKQKQKTAQEKRINFDNMGLSELGTQPVHYSSGEGNLFRFRKESRDLQESADTSRLFRSSWGLAVWNFHGSH